MSSRHVQPMERRLLLADNPDLTFGTDGYAFIAEPQIALSDMAVMSDDRIVTVGQWDAPDAAPQYAIARWTADGAPDATFGNNGLTLTEVLSAAAGGHDEDVVTPWQLALADDGKPIVAGTAQNKHGDLTVLPDHELVLARYNLDGALDASFGDDGLARLALDKELFVVAVDTLADGKIAVFGRHDPLGTPGLFFARFNADGSPDGTFGGGDGWLAVGNLPAGDQERDAAIQSDGKVVVVTSAGVDDDVGLHAYRFNADGTPDNTFAGDGRAEHFVGDWTGSGGVEIAADGDIIVSGASESHDGSYGSLARLNPDGSLDTAFGTNGLVFTFGGFFNQLALGPDGSIAVRGGQGLDAIFRFTAAGAPLDGWATGALVGGGGAFEPRELALQSNGKVVMGGWHFINGNRDNYRMAVGRVTDEPVPFDAANNGILVVRGTTGSDVVSITTTATTIDVVRNGASSTFATDSYLRMEFHGQGGNDTMTFAGVFPLQAFGGDGNDTMTGGVGNDFLRGDAGDDVLDGGDGADRLEGSGGNDSLTGGDGDDDLSGFDGHDTLVGNGGDDHLHGGAGILNDFEIGNDSLLGGDGNDLIDGNGGNDFAAGGAGRDAISGDEGDDRLHGNDGNDRLRGGPGRDSLYGGAQKDMLIGGDQPDLLSGGGGKDRMAGEGGHDRLYGGDGDDALDGGGHNDRLFGHAGIDKLFGGLRADTLDGGAGADLIFADNSDEVVEDPLDLVTMLGT